MACRPWQRNESLSERSSGTMKVMATGNLDYTQNIWRVGRKVGRTIYAQLGTEPTDDDPLIGIFDTIELAAAAVEVHNLSLRPSVQPENFATLKI